MILARWPPTAATVSAEIAAAVSAGIIVCFSASNGGWGFPAQMPEVLAVGGVFMERDGSMRASDYASGFQSNVYPGRRVPDVSGLVGMRPKAIYIMLPQPDGSVIENGNAGRVFPNGDETAMNDWWAAFSGTSASCPQVAGVCALIKGKPHGVVRFRRRSDQQCRGQFDPLGWSESG